MKLGIDCDGVMHNFHKPFLKFLGMIGWFEERGLQPPGPDFSPSHYSFYKEWGMTTEEFKEICDRGVDAGIIFAEGEPYEGCKETLDYLKSRGHSIHVITHRVGKHSLHNTIDWLDEYEIPRDTLTFAEDKTIVGVDLLIDDFKGNWKASIQQGIPCVIMDRPWNSHLTSAVRVKGWKEFAMFVEDGPDPVPDLSRVDL
ncbi:MAG: 5' nucleotidase, NT5C type [bacterium]